MNDSIVGFNRTSIEFSVDGGDHWGAISTAPFGYRLNAPDQLLPTAADPNRHTIKGDPGTLHSYDACSDPYLAADSHGRFFYSCVGFDIASNAGLAFVVPSPVGAKGSYFDQVPAPFDITAPYTGREHIISEDNSAAASYDAPKVAADSYVNSPNRDNVYFTWTVFDFSCGDTHDQYCESPIWGSMSTDHGFTWSTPETISGVNPSICTLGDVFNSQLDPGSCNLDGHSDIQVRPNGDLAATFISQNTPTQDPEILALQCHPTGNSVAGTAHLNCDQPTKVSDYVTGPGCDFGRGRNSASPVRASAPRSRPPSGSPSTRKPATCSTRGTTTDAANSTSSSPGRPTAAGRGVPRNWSTPTAAPTTISPPSTLVRTTGPTWRSATTAPIGSPGRTTHPPQDSAPTWPPRCPTTSSPAAKA